MKTEPEEALRIILELVGGRIRNAFGLDPIDEVHILTPMNRGLVGTANLNLELQKALNPREDGVARGGCVRQYERGPLEVFNGDIGRIIRIDTEMHELTITFDGRSVVYDYSDLDELVLTYVVSVRMAQGSEYPCMVIPLLIQHYILLQRNLLYTAITRGKRLVIVVGSKKALAIAVKNDKTQKRFTWLDARLKR